MSVKILFCYAHEDAILLNKLKIHLQPLRRQGVIDAWYDRDISVGTEWNQEINTQLKLADITLLLISPDFMVSDYCYSLEMKQAIERHERGETSVIPILLRPVYYQGAPFAKLQVLPRDAKPIITWPNQDDAFFDIAVSISKVVEQMNVKPPVKISEPLEVLERVIDKKDGATNQERLELLTRGVSIWNKWKQEHSNMRPDLSGANLSGAFLMGANLSGADLSQSNLSDADLSGANLSGANLSGAFLIGVDFRGADLSNADLSNADASDVNLSGADLSGANLSGANLKRTVLVRTILNDANLTGAYIHGISAWNLQLEGAKQSNLIITDTDEPTITVDNLQAAQFIYLLLNNQQIRNFIDTISSKSVLILGRFTPERKAVLDTLRETLRVHGYVPILFDFDKPNNRSVIETISTLAHLSRFIIADLTDASTIPYELQAIIPALAVPVQPILEAPQREYTMFRDLINRYSWVLPTYLYTDPANLSATLREKVLDPAEMKAQELTRRTV